ncbi:hypothetical protein HN587_06455 [Candidatus Woesearchaeota archaeon]|jgi:hypothetical protein|nr:hypothetical protein [Candidatus Woesearchaeota archaeon]
MKKINLIWILVSLVLVNSIFVSSIGEPFVNFASKQKMCFNNEENGLYNLVFNIPEGFNHVSASPYYCLMTLGNSKETSQGDLLSSLTNSNYDYCCEIFEGEQKVALAVNSDELPNSVSDFYFFNAGVDVSCWNSHEKVLHTDGYCADLECVDNDGDGFFSPVNQQFLAAVCDNQDCDDSTNYCTDNCWVDNDADGLADCSVCIDNDGDNYGINCLNGADCLDSNPNCNSDCGDYNNNNKKDCAEENSGVDLDGDGFCETCEKGPDCDESTTLCRLDCETDKDNDGISDCKDPCIDQDGDWHCSEDSTFGSKNGFDDINPVIDIFYENAEPGTFNIADFYTEELKRVINNLAPDDLNYSSYTVDGESSEASCFDASSDLAIWSCANKLAISLKTYFDCDDSNSSIYSGCVEEICDGIDNDGDGYVDECNSKFGLSKVTHKRGCIYDETPRCVLEDLDQDGYGNISLDCFNCNDCDDNNYFINPFVLDDTLDNIDQNCNGIFDDELDSDGDGVSDINDDCPQEIKNYDDQIFNEDTGCIRRPDYWKNDSGVEAYISAIDYKEGDFSLKLIANNGKKLFQSFIVEPNQIYSFSVYAKIVRGEFEVKITGSPTINSTVMSDLSWNRYVLMFNSTNHELINIEFESLQADSIIVLDALQLEEAEVATKFINFQHKDYGVWDSKGCCPQDYCWTGGSLKYDIDKNPETGESGKEILDCVHDDVYETNACMPPLGWETSVGDNQAGLFKSINCKGADCADSGYRCINGDWKLSKIKYSPYRDQAGFCPNETMCYAGALSSSSENESCEVDKVCFESGGWSNKFSPSLQSEMSESFYCYNGEWTTRTKSIAMQLLKIAENSNNFTLFCDEFKLTLIPGQKGYRGLELPEELYSSQLIENFFKNKQGAGLGYTSTNNTVNEFCVLNMDEKVIVGVSLNVLPNETIGDEGLSFWKILRGEDNYCEEAMTSENYTSCDSVQDVFYDSKLNSVIFTKNGQKVPQLSEKTFLDETIEVLRNLLDRILKVFGITATGSQYSKTAHEMADSNAFISDTGDFDKLFISSHPGPNNKPKTIRAVHEYTYNKNHNGGDGGVIDFIEVQYDNYKTNICDYFDYRLFDPDRPYILQRDNKPKDVVCTPVILNEDDWYFSIYVYLPKLECSLNFCQQDYDDTFWNDITASLRLRSAKEFDELDQENYYWNVSSNHVAVEAPIKFNMVNGSNNIIGFTYEFGDGTNAAKTGAFNQALNEFEHFYTMNGTYTPKVYLLLKNFEIVEAKPIGTGEIIVEPKPKIQINEEQILGPLYKFEVIVEGGESPYTFMFDFGEEDVDPVVMHNGVVTTEEDMAELNEITGNSITGNVVVPLNFVPVQPLLDLEGVQSFVDMKTIEWQDSGNKLIVSNIQHQYSAGGYHDVSVEVGTLGATFTKTKRPMIKAS